ncbi:hypothetical protein CHUAL_010089 [Chamberlinius hualienensis]
MESKGKHYIILEIIVRFILFFLFAVTSDMEPFKRKIQLEELWLYKNPKTQSYVPLRLLMVIVSVVPLSVLLFFAFTNKRRSDAVSASLGFTLSVGMNSLMTNYLKIIVGRPRPDFFWRCFPDGQFRDDMQCTGVPDEINDGLKSFPSGHSSLAFSTLGFLSFYLAGKLKCFVATGRGQSWRLCLTLLPLIGAIGVAISRTCDYHHHWQDVSAGSIMGLVIAHLCYRQYFPSITSSSCDQAYMPKGLKDQVRFDELIIVKSEVKSV